MSYPPPGYPPGPPNPYGGPPGPYGQVPPLPSPPLATNAITALVLGVVSLFLCGFFTGIPAILLGISARREIRRSEGRVSGDGIALGAIITGALGTLWTLVAAAVVIAALVFGASVVEEYDEACDNVRNGQDETFLGEPVDPADCL